MFKQKEIKRIWNKTGMKQIINTGHKTFDKQTNIIDNHSNMIANTQLAFYIRAYNDVVNPIGETVDKGHLQDFDLKSFNNLPYKIKEFCKNNADDGFWLSEFRIFNNNHKQVICYFLRNLNTNKVYTFNNAINYKQDNLIEWLKNYLFDKEQFVK